MIDVPKLFASPTASHPLTARCIWADYNKMKDWLHSVFDAILATPSRETARINVPPFRLLHDGKNLFSVGLLAIFDLRPHDAVISHQDLEYLFCDAFLNSIKFMADESDLFPSWVASMIFRIPEEEPFLDFVTADYIRDYLLYMAIHDPLLARMHLTEGRDYVPLFVSGLFAIHIGGLWPQLLDRIEAHRRLQIKLSFKLIEMFLNRFAEQELRFRGTSSEYVKETLNSFNPGSLHPYIQLREESVLRVLRLTQEHTSIQTLEADTKDTVGGRGKSSKDRRRTSLENSGKRAKGVSNLEYNDAA